MRCAEPASLPIQGLLQAGDVGTGSSGQRNVSESGEFARPRAEGLRLHLVKYPSSDLSPGPADGQIMDFVSKLRRSQKEH